MKNGLQIVPWKNCSCFSMQVSTLARAALHEILAAVRSLNEQEQVFHALGRSPAQSPP
jgi:hypothetical protein